MKHLLAPIAALFALVAAPLAAQPLAAGEIELKIEALGDIPADTAVVPVQIVGRGKDDAAAKADLAKKEKEAYAALAALGIPLGKIKPVADSDPQYPVIESAYGCAVYDGAAMDASESPQPVAPPVVMTTGSMPDCNPERTKSRMLMVTVEDLTKLPAIMDITGEDYFSRSLGRFYHRDEAAAHTAAIAKAIVNARAEAEAYAAALGMRVVRVIRVGNAKPKVNWPDLMMLFGGITNGMDPGTSESSALYELRAMAAAHFAGVTIDFVIASK